MAQLQIKQGIIKTIIADEPQAGYQFDQWNGDVEFLVDPMSSTTSITMPAQNVIVTASYSEIVFTPVEYGALYNWYAATDARKITSSDDWVAPTQAQIETLLNYAGAANNFVTNHIGGKLKEVGLSHWTTPNTGATNELGYNARGAGYRQYTDGSFNNSINAYSYHWSQSTLINWPYILNLYFQSDLGWLTYVGSKSYGYSIRLLYTGSGTPTTYTGNDGKVYPVVLIGTQRWLSCNLNETKFRNGDWITGFDGGVYTPISNANWAAKTTEAMCYYNDDVNNG